MNQELYDETVLRKYLLGELKLDEQVLVEQRLFLDDEYLKVAKALEDELIDEYSDQVLTAQERERFESHFLASPERRQDLRITQALKRVASATTKSPQPTNLNSQRGAFTKAESFVASFFARRPVVGFAFVAILIVLSVISWRVYQSRRVEQERPPTLAHEGGASTNDQRRDDNPLNLNNQGRVDENQNRNEDRAGREPSPTPAEQPSEILITAVVMPGPVVRGDSKPLTSIAVPSRKGFVSLTLPLEDTRDYRSYNATLRRDGRTIRSLPRLKSQIDQKLGKIVVVRIATTLLSSSLYEVNVRGRASDGKESPAGSYAFEVRKQ